MQKTIVFIDTSIQIAKTIRDQRIKTKIRSRLSKYKLKVTGSIALQEFKRRVLRDVYYILTKLNQTDSYQDTLDFITSVLPRQQQRRKEICLPILHNLLFGRSDEELTERTRRYCRTLLVDGEKHFMTNMDAVLPGVQCYWARFPIREMKRYLNYDLGQTKCSKSNGQCQVGNVLKTKKELCSRLLDFLKSLPYERMTSEIQSARDFLTKLLDKGTFDAVQNEEPCLAFGDLLLALESEGIPDFYTMNYRESQAYCDFLEQDLTVLQNNPDHDEQTFQQSSKPWPTLKVDTEYNR